MQPVVYLCTLGYFKYVLRLPRPAGTGPGCGFGFLCLVCGLHEGGGGVRGVVPNAT